ncbi:hypothetical protein WN943_007992 [Citrus x changshan-huyou]
MWTTKSNQRLFAASGIFSCHNFRCPPNEKLLAGEVNSLVSELSNVSAKEHALLGQCKDLLSTIAAMQVKECSLRTHILQSERLPASLTSKV